MMAWALICKRYNNCKLIVHLYFLFVNLPVVKNSSFKDLQNLKDKVNDIRAAFMNLDCQVETWKNLFNYIIITKWIKSR